MEFIISRYKGSFYSIIAVEILYLNLHNLKIDFVPKHNVTLKATGAT